MIECMSSTERIILDALALPPAERLDVIDRLWDSLAESPDDFELTEEQRRELDRRLDEMRANPDAAIPWEQVKAELQKRR